MSGATAAPRVLFFAPFGTYTVHHQLDAVVASALRLRGADVVVIRCDGVLPICDQHAWASDRDSICAQCKNCGDPFFDAFDLETFQLRAALSDSDITTAEAWVGGLDLSEYSSACFSGVPIGSWVTSSLFSYYRITPDVLREPEVSQSTAGTHRRLLVTGLLTHLAMSRIIAQVKPTHMFCFNARYAPYRVAFETARAAGVEVLTHERGHADGTFLVYSNYGAIQTKPAFDGYQIWKDVSLLSDELARVKSYFANREQGSDSNFEPFIDFSTDYASVRSLLRIPPDARVIGVFTSSEYEFALCPDYNTFVDQLELIERLILVFRERPDDYLVIRHHPYLAGNASALADNRFIQRAHDLALNAPPNVRVIMPGERINTYALINNLAGAISFLSTAGVEAVARGVATASFRESIYRDALSVSIEDDGRRYLHHLIDDLIDKTERFGIEDLRRLYRFQSMFISRLSNRFESFSIKDTYAPDVRAEKFSMLVDRGDEALDRVCDHVFYNTPLLPIPTKDRVATSKEAEDKFLTNVLAEIANLKDRIGKECRKAIACFKEESLDLFLVGDFEKPPAGLDRSRHKAIQMTQVSSFAGLTYNHLANLISKSSANFTAIASPVVEYDQSFFSGGVDILNADLSRNSDAALFGAWIRQSNGRIVDQIFSKRTPQLSLDRLKYSYPLLAKEPRHLLSLLIFRKESVVAFFKSLGAMLISDEETLEPIYHFICSERVIRTMGHGVVLTKP